MTYNDVWPEEVARISKDIPFENKTTEVVAANVQAKATAAATDRTTAPVLPATQVYMFDGVPTIVARPPLSDHRNVAQQVSVDELRAMDQDVEKWPDCEFPGCKPGKGQGRYKIISGAGKPLSINRDGQLVVGTPNPIVEEKMSALDRARASLAGIGIEVAKFSASGGVQPAQLAPKSFVNVCLAHQTLPFAPKAPPKRFVSGPYPGIATASARANDVGLRTRRGGEVFSVKRHGRDEFYVRGDDGAPGYAGILEDM
jgi:hypothetical protein